MATLFVTNQPDSGKYTIGSVGPVKPNQVIQPAAPKPVPTLTVKQAQPTQKIIPPKVTDVSDRYANINGTIWDKKTYTAFRTPQEFFDYSGLKDFSVKFDTNWKPLGSGKLVDQPQTVVPSKLTTENKTTTPKTIEPSLITAPTELIKGGLQGIARGYASTVLTAAQVLDQITSPVTGGGNVPSSIDTSKNDLLKEIFGDAGIKSIPLRIAQNKSTFGWAAAPLVLGSTILDFTGFGGEKNVAKALAKLTDVGEIAKILKKSKFADDLIPEMSQVIAKIDNEKDITKVINKYKEVQQAAKTISSDAKTLDTVRPRTVPASATQRLIEGAGEKARQVPLEGLGQEANRVQPVLPQAKIGTGPIRPLDIAAQSKSYTDNIAQVGKKERGFLTSVKESPTIAPQVKKAIELSPEEVRTYSVFTDKAAITNAEAKIASTPEAEVTRYVLTSKPDKDVATTGIALMKKMQEAGNFKGEADIANHLAQEYTKAGQFIQAASLLDKLSPEGWVTYAAKRMAKAGDVLPPKLTEEIITKAKEIQKIPDDLPYEKFIKVQDLAGTITRNIPRSKLDLAKDWLMELWTLPKTTAASFDLSAGLRQGIVPMSSFPKEWGRAFKAQFKAAASEKGYAELMNSVMNNQYFKMAQEAGVSFTDVAAKLGAREDRFMSSFAEKIPILGRGIKFSNRGYTGFLNKMRMDMFASMAETAKRLGIETDAKWLHDTGRFINDATGRGTWKAAEGSLNNILQGVMFSPRLMYSRLNLLASPISYIGAAPQVRKQLWKSLFTFGASTATMLGLADLIPGVEVGKDPRSADFGKIKIGNTRIDIMGGFQQYIRIAAQVASGKYISTTTGKVITLGEGYKPLTKKDILIRGVESKESPMAALISTLLTGKNFEGDSLNTPGEIAKEIGSKFVPMALNDIWEEYKEDPRMLPFGFTGLFGVGVQTYPMTPAIEEMKRINVSADPSGEFLKLKAKDPILAEKVATAKKQESFTEFDWGLTYMGVENGDRAKFLVEHFNRLGSKEEKAALWNDLQKKGLLSNQVSEQIKYLLANPDYKIPNQ